MSEQRMKEVLAHVKSRIDASEVSEDIEGYPYIQILNFFPDDYYEELGETCKGMDTNVFQVLSKVYTTRSVYQLTTGENNISQMNNFSDLTEKQRNFWKDFQTTFLSNDYFKNAFLDKYSDHIDFPYPDQAYSNFRLQRDFKGYKIGPHRDRLDKVLSVMFYTPTTTDPDILEDHGTALLTPKFDDPETYPLHPDHVGAGKDRHFLFEDMNLVKTAASIPNSIYSWAVAAKSYHGVTPLQSDHCRHTMAFFLKIPKQLTSYHKLYGDPDFKKQ